MIFRSPRTRQEKFSNIVLSTILRQEPELGDVKFRRRELRDGWDDIMPRPQNNWKRKRRTQYRAAWLGGF